MEAWVEKVFSDDVVREAVKRFGAESDSIEKLGSFENYVFEVTKNGQPYILRLTHSSHRTIRDVEAELNWVNFLNNEGVKAAKANRSENDKMVEVIDVPNGAFYVCLFDKAPGRQLEKGDELYGPELYESWGKTIGKMHRVTKDFKAGSFKREHWDEEDLLQFDKYLSTEEDRDVINEGNRLVKEIQDLPKERETYGLIHSDLHAGNFFYDDGDLHVFDFDDSSYHYYISDIAIPLYYTVWGGLQGEGKDTRAQFAEEFLYYFLKGYISENNVSSEWVKKIPPFLKLRDYILYTVLHKKFDLSNMEELEGKLLHQIKDRLDRGELIAEPSYERVIEKVDL